MEPCTVRQGLPSAKTLVDGTSPSSFAADASKLGLATVVSQAISLLCAPILARIFPPAAYGGYAIFLSITSLISVAACFRYQLALVLPESEREAKSLFYGALFLLLFYATLCLLICYLGRSLLGRMLHSPEAHLFELWIPLYVLLTGASFLFDGWLSRMRRFGTKGLQGVTGSLTHTVSSIALGLKYGGSEGLLVLSSFLSSAFSLVVQIQASSSNLWPTRDVLRLSNIARQLSKYKKFPLIDTWAALLNTLSMTMAPLLLAFFFCNDVVGQYSRSLQLLQLPMSLIGASIGQVFYQRAALLRGSGDLSALVRSTFLTLCSVGMFPFFFLAIVGKELFVFFLGQNWALAGTFSQIVSPWCLLVFIASPISGLLLVLGKQEINLLFNVLMVALRMLSLTIGGWMGNAPLGVGLFSATGCLLWILLCAYLLRLADLRIKSVLSELVPSLLVTLAFAGGLVLIKALFPSNALLVIVVGVTFVAFYFRHILTHRPELAIVASSLLNAVRRRAPQSVTR